MRNKFFAMVGTTFFAASLLVPSAALAAPGGVAGASADNAAAIDENAAGIDANAAAINANTARIKALQAIIKRMTSTVCDEGEFLIGFEHDGTPICEPAPTGGGSSGTTVTLPNNTQIDLDTGNTETCLSQQLCKMLKGADFSYDAGTIRFDKTSTWWTADSRVSYEDVNENTKRSLGQIGGASHIPSNQTTLIVRTDTGAEFKLGLWSWDKKLGLTFTYELLSGGSTCPPLKKCLP